MRCRFFKHCISAQLLMKIKIIIIIIVIIITLFVDIDSCGGCVELFSTRDRNISNNSRAV